MDYIANHDAKNFDEWSINSGTTYHIAKIRADLSNFMDEKEIIIFFHEIQCLFECGGD